MITQSFKKIWKNKRKNRLLLHEFFHSFILLFILITLISSAVINKKTSLGFDYEHVWMGILDPQTVISDSLLTVRKKDIFKQITSDHEVILMSELQHNQPFVRNSTYTNYFKYDDIIAKKVYAFGADDNFCDVFNLNLLEGRWFNESDINSRYLPIVINRTLQKELGANKQIIGSVVEFHWLKEKCRVVGIVDDFKYQGDYSSLRNEVFYRTSLDMDLSNYDENFFETYEGNMQTKHDKRIYLKVKAGSDLSLEERLLNDLNNQYPDWNFKFKPLKEQRAQYLKNNYAPVQIFLGLSIFLIFNVAIGLFTVLWYTMNHRKEEIAIRKAAGATRKHIFLQMIEEMLLLSTLGMLPGILLAVQFPILRAFNIEPVTYVMAILLTLATIYMLVTLCALFPGLQATKIQPAEALHEE